MNIQQIDQFNRSWLASSFFAKTRVSELQGKIIDKFIELIDPYLGHVGWSNKTFQDAILSDWEFASGGIEAIKAVECMTEIISINYGASIIFQQYLAQLTDIVSENRYDEIVLEDGTTQLRDVDGQIVFVYHRN